MVECTIHGPAHEPFQCPGPDEAITVTGFERKVAVESLMSAIRALITERDHAVEECEIGRRRVQTMEETIAQERHAIASLREQRDRAVKERDEDREVNHKAVDRMMAAEQEVMRLRAALERLKDAAETQWANDVRGLILREWAALSGEDPNGR